jgi:rhomboid protease GluP
MQFDNGGFSVLATTSDARNCAELGLVLEARSIEIGQEQVGQTWVLWVANDDLGRARIELDQYVRENTWAPERIEKPNEPHSAWQGVVVYCIVLIAMVAPVTQRVFDRNWLAVGRLDSARIFEGEWWRAVTALTLHADAAHLLGNAGFGAFFGYSLSRSFGGGIAWLAILASGFAGNMANALLAGPDHRSIGASTAVFGALGILTAFSWRTGFREHKRGRQRIAPIIAGLGLLALTGTGGENTDIGAHLLGFVAGFGIGLGAAAFEAPRSAKAQLLAGTTALGIITLAWFAALSG